MAYALVKSVGDQPYWKPVVAIGVTPSSGNRCIGWAMGTGDDAVDPARAGAVNAASAVVTRTRRNNRRICKEPWRQGYPCATGGPNRCRLERADAVWCAHPG